MSLIKHRKGVGASAIRSGDLCHGNSNPVIGIVNDAATVDAVGCPLLLFNAVYWKTSCKCGDLCGS
eukprot:scaffold48754_cov20-Prasinocladus_malaysianus.AAC.1